MTGRRGLPALDRGQLGNRRARRRLPIPTRAARRSWWRPPPLRSAPGAGLPATFWWLWAGLLVNAIGTFALPFLSLYVTRGAQLPVSFVAVVLGLFGVGSVAAAVLGGCVADRVGRRRTLLGAQAGTVASTLALGWTHSRLSVAACVLLFGFAINLTGPVLRALVADVAAPATRPAAYALTGWASTAGATVAPALAGLLATVSYRLLFAADAASTALFALLIFLSVPETAPAGHRTAVAPDPAAAATVPAGGVAHDRVLLAVVGLNLAFALIYLQGQSTLPLVMTRAGLSPAAYGTALSIAAVVVLVLQLPAVRLLGRLPRDRVLAGSALLVGVGFGLGALVHGRVGYTAAVIVWTVAELPTIPFSLALVADLSPAAARGRYQGAYQLSWSTGRLLGPALGVAVLDTAGPTALWAGCTALGIAVGAGHLLAAPARHRRLRPIEPG